MYTTWPNIFLMSLHKVENFYFFQQILQQIHMVEPRGAAMPQQDRDKGKTLNVVSLPWVFKTPIIFPQ